MKKSLHIVCFDTPAPPNYGGAIDMYYKIKALASIGIDIKLHYFSYKEGREPGELKNVCSETYCYKRNTGLSGISLNQPYIVSSRINKELIENLNADTHPILLEGFHCTGIIPFLHKQRKIIIRVHNDEAMYYQQLYKFEKSFIKKTYFKLESMLLAAYQKKLPQTASYVCLSDKDMATLKNKYCLSQTHYVPCFIPWQTITSLEGKGNYCLYHGNLMIAENKKAVWWLIENVFAKISVPFVIAGKGASIFKQQTNEHPHISIVNNPSDESLDDLIRNAHINLLPSLNCTGVKLKVLHAYFNGRFCIVNPAAIEGSGIEAGITIASKPLEYINAIKKLMQLEFSSNDKEQRNYLLPYYDNLANAARLSELL